MNVPQTTLDLFRQTSAEWIEGARLAAERLLLTQETITIRDVLAVHEFPTYLKRNLIGNVFQDRARFKQVGTPVRSASPAARGHYIHYWTFADGAFPTVRRLTRIRELSKVQD